MNKILRSAAIVAASAVSFATAASAQVLSSIDFTASTATWNAAMTTPLHLDFGSGLGMGTLSFTSVNGGSFVNAGTPFAYNDLLYSPYNGPTTLASGAIFAPTMESVFVIQPGAGANGLSGFTMTVSLDSGSFATGSVFSVRSLGTSGTNHQYFQPGANVGAADPTQLPTDGHGNVSLVELDAVNHLYGAASDTGASNGLAFAVSGSSFTVSLLTTPGYQPGGVAFTVATPPVPEPSTYALLFAGLGVMGLVASRRRRAMR